MGFLHLPPHSLSLFQVPLSSSCNLKKAEDPMASAGCPDSLLHHPYYQVWVGMDLCSCQRVLVEGQSTVVVSSHGSFPSLAGHGEMLVQSRGVEDCDTFCLGLPCFSLLCKIASSCSHLTTASFSEGVYCRQACLQLPGLDTWNAAATVFAPPGPHTPGGTLE